MFENGYNEKRFSHWGTLALFSLVGYIVPIIPILLLFLSKAYPEKSKYLQVPSCFVVLLHVGYLYSTLAIYKHVLMDSGYYPLVLCLLLFGPGITIFVYSRYRKLPDYIMIWNIVIIFFIINFFFFMTVMSSWA
jgi:hypothetical protein